MKQASQWRYRIVSKAPQPMSSKSITQPLKHNLLKYMGTLK